MAQTDSTALLEDPMIHNVLDNTIGESPLLVSLLISLLILVLVAFTKRLVKKDRSYKDWGDCILELPIDICTILISVIITYRQVLGSNTPFVLLFMTLFFILLASACRANALTLINKSNKKALWWGLADVASVGIWMFVFFRLL